MKNLEKLTLAEREILTPSKMKQIRGGSGISGGCNGIGTSGTSGQNYMCRCHDHNTEWRGCYDVGAYGGVWYYEDLYNICGGYDRGTCERV